jgi:Lrp/AsnC family transcriptional regulator, leucine-responsive regulatory protein
MDDLDRKILRAFQKDARRKNADLAKDLGVAPSTMLERVRRLKERGYFDGYRAIINPEKLGFSIQALISVSLSEHSTETIRPFEEAVKKISNILTCYHVTGRFDYIAQVVAKDLTHLGLIVKEHIASIPGVGKTETFIVFSEIKKENGYPLEDADQ